MAGAEAGDNKDRARVSRTLEIEPVASSSDTPEPVLFSSLGACAAPATCCSWMLGNSANSHEL